ncbi:AbiH family protein [Flavobacterium ponti]|uniref:AbiH family protein n=1 Tax=Flavobacterium ponti TaxID=665133 RepID=A0ABV9P9I4_9FLAO
MNRLVIIGNGFDLAHGLPTSYKDFIDDYWSSIKDLTHNDIFISFEGLKISVDFEIASNLQDIANSLIALDEKVKFSDAEIYTEHGNNLSGSYPRNHILIYKNQFFKLINNRNSENWVDVENLYYSELKKITKSKCLDTRKSDDYWIKEQNKAVQKLNDEFEDVKNLLEKYLIEKVNDRYEFNHYSGENLDWSLMSKNLLPISLFSNEETILKQFSKKEDIEEIKKYFENEKKEELISNLYFLTFNYTFTVKKYAKIIKSDRIETIVNFIHGEIGNKTENKINFGFGDEMDEDYKLIENINENEYLQNFKSFQYLQNSNYSNLLSYIDSEKYQVLIVGHSCGLSDRTMLNTIFEHENCRSIKVFYYERKDENHKVIGDNYTELVQNISRHFNKKKLMREKIVNKTLCQPLPQIKLSKKE